MKSVAFIIIFFLTGQMYSQNISAKDIINDNTEWFGQPYDPTLEIKQYVYKPGERTNNITSFVFSNDGTFTWKDNPKCGLSMHATGGQGKWKLEKNILTLDFKQVVTEMKGKRGVEKYKIVSLNKNEMILEIIK